MKSTFILIFLCIGSILTAQERPPREQHISKLVVEKKKREVFRQRDSSMVVHIDTLVMRDNATLEFFGVKDAKLVIKHAEIGKRGVITGIGARNNATNFDIEINIQKLGSLYVMANGRDANNGFTTHPNGDGGNVTFKYDPRGIKPQTENRKQKNYLAIDVSAGGYHVNPVSDMRIIMDRIAMAQPGLRGMPGGQVYSGSPGREGKKVIESLPLEGEAGAVKP